MLETHNRRFNNQNRAHLYSVIEVIDATMQLLALLGDTFYSMGVSSPILTISSTLSGLIFHMIDAARYAILPLTRTLAQHS
jgi:hypothetical protein